MSYNVRKAQREDLKQIEEIYAGARLFMEQTGNASQWGKHYPPVDLLEQDIAEQTLYVISEKETIHGVFYFWIGEDPTYQVIYDGFWRRQTSYGTIHRIASDGSGGILAEAVSFASRQISHLRMDTHRDNHIMQRALEKQGFQKCGTIYLPDGTERIAYDKID